MKQTRRIADLSLPHNVIIDRYLKEARFILINASFYSKHKSEFEIKLDKLIETLDQIVEDEIIKESADELMGKMIKDIGDEQ